MKHPHTSSLLPVSALAVVIALFALPDSAPALSGSGGIFTSTCVRFKAGRTIKTGACKMYISVGNEFYVNFADEEKGEGEPATISYECLPSRSHLPDAEADKLPDCVAQIFPLQGQGDRHCVENDVMPGEKCAYTLDQRPAFMPKNPPKPAQTWFCLQKTGTDEVMCLKRSWDM